MNNNSQAYFENWEQNIAGTDCNAKNQHRSSRQQLKERELQKTISSYNLYSVSLPVSQLA